MKQTPLNPQALTAYRYAMYGLIPVVGLVCGAVAVVVGTIACIRCRAQPAAKGRGHALAAVILGSLELVTNSVGLAFIWIGLQTLGDG